jgi:hypothetical protein
MRNYSIPVTWLSLVLSFSFSAYGIEHDAAMAKGIVDATLAGDDHGKPGPFGPNDGGGGKPKLLEASQTGPPKPGPNDGGGGKLIDTWQKQKYLHNKEDRALILTQQTPPKQSSRGGPNSGGGNDDKKGSKAIPMNQGKNKLIP